MFESTFVDNIINVVLAPIMKVIEAIISFTLGSKILTIVTFLATMTWLGYYTMKMDKRYAKEKERRIPEIQLLLIALMGGSIGMYIGMYKFKHKTLHKKFSIGVPLIMLGQMALAVSEITIRILGK